MAEEVWWVDPPRNVTAGGWCSYSQHDDEINGFIERSNREYPVGFTCVKLGGTFPPPEYDSFSFHSMFQFSFPTQASGTMTYAKLHLRVTGAEMQGWGITPPT